METRAAAGGVHRPHCFFNDQIVESHRVTMANTAASTRHMKSPATRPTADKSAKPNQKN
jgi:hypothetical protein